MSPNEIAGNASGRLTFPGGILNISDPVASEVISSSMITSSFNSEERFDWTTRTGLRVHVPVPPRQEFVPFERATAAELRDRLFQFPNVQGHRNRRAPQPTPTTDNSYSWWCAQLIHYGLLITSDRDAAQKSLKRAIHTGTLAVPSRLRELETKLKRRHMLYPIVRPGLLSSEQRVRQGVVVTDSAMYEAHHEGHLPSRNVSGNVSNSSVQQSNFQTYTSLRNDDQSDPEGEYDHRPTPKPPHRMPPDSLRATRSAIHPGPAEGDKRREQTPEQGRHPKNRIGKKKAVETDEGDDDETASVVFYTPMEFRNKNNNINNTSQQGPVVFLGSETSPQRVNAAKHKNHDILRKGQPVKHLQTTRCKTRDIIEISSDEDDSSEEEFLLQRSEAALRNPLRKPDQSVGKSSAIKSKSSTVSTLASQPTSKALRAYSSLQSAAQECRQNEPAKCNGQVLVGKSKGKGKKKENLERGSSKHRRVDLCQVKVSTPSQEKELAQNRKSCDIDDADPDPDSDLPSMRKLFYSQGTPENWKLNNRQSAAEKKKRTEIRKPYDPDSVPALRETLATVPSCLKTCVRHDSPELPHTCMSAALPYSDLTRAASVSAERSRSRSVSMRPASRKRPRPSLLEIEGDATEMLPSKRQRM